MATMETWETSSPGLENMGMYVSHVLMGDMRSNQHIYTTRLQITMGMYSKAILSSWETTEDMINWPQISLHYHLSFNLEHKKTCVGKQEGHDSHGTMQDIHPSLENIAWVWMSRMA
jgi:hypothetical protein